MSLFIEKIYNGNNKFTDYPYELSDFQKISVEAIDNDNNVLVCAPTASGKTLVAEHLIQKYSKLNQNKKNQVIYTAPIKALSNFLYNDLTKKFPDISFGIMTGDIKYNPEADCVIMTTEILRNLLYNKKMKTNINLDIEIDVYNNVSAVIYDEVHYIADKNRGRVWEESIILLPEKIQLVMLSATIHKPELFAKWISDIKNRPMTLSIATKRVVPLVYFMFNTFTSKIDNIKKPDEETESILKLNKNMKVIMNEKNELVGREILDTQKKLKHKYHNCMSSKAIFSELTEYLITKNLLPSIVFTLSRKNCELYASQLNIIINNEEEQSEVLNIFDSKIHKCHNYKEIMKMTDYYTIRELLKKGIAYHHAGVYHIFKEIIEILLSHKPNPLIKMLFATETFAIGINIPVKSVSYSGLTKFTDNQKRYLLPHEFRQMSGRAGRRGMDKLGVSILLPNLYDLPGNEELKNIMSGQNQLIKSQFIPNFQFILKLILTGNKQIFKFMNKSLIQNEISETCNCLDKELEDTEEISIDKKIIDFFDNLQELEKRKQTNFSQKNIKKNHNEIMNIKQSYEYKENLNVYNKYIENQNKIKTLKTDLINNSEYLKSVITSIVDYLQYYEYITNDIPKENFDHIEPEHITSKGLIASQINECNEILLTEIITKGYLYDLTKEEIAICLSVFIDSKLNDQSYDISLESIEINTKTKSILKEIAIIKDEFLYYLPKVLYSSDSNWELHLNMMNVVKDWIHGMSINEITQKYDIYIGNFVKDIIKLNNIIQCVMNSAEIIQNYSLQSLCSDIEPLLIRDIVNVDSIYLK